MPIQFTVTASPNDKIVTIADPIITIEDVIPPVYSTVNNTLKNLTEGEATLNYYIGAMTYQAGDKIAIVIRKGLVHGFDGSSEMVRFITDDGANTWVRDILFSESGFDVRNYGGGSTSEGIILIFYGRLAGGSSWTSMRCMRSADGGVTFTHSSDLMLYKPEITIFSPHGRLVELENGTLLQSFYGWDANDTTYIWTLKSTDRGLTWGSPVLIDSGAIMYEPSLVYLGGGKMIAAIRQDVGGTEKDILIYNSSDSGATYTSYGKCKYLSTADLPGTSPLIFKKNSDTATIISTARRQYNAFIEVTLPFGTANTIGLYRSFYEGLPKIPTGTNINFGYPALLSFNSNEQDQLIAFYDISPRWVSGNAITDVLVGPVFRRVQTISVKTSGTYATGTSVYTPAAYIVDELTVYNSPTNPTYQHKIRTAGSYSIRVEGTFTGSGTSRDFNIQRYTSAGSFSANMFTESGSGNTYDFTTTQTMATNEAIVLQIVHDANPLTVVSLKMTITKL